MNGIVAYSAGLVGAIASGFLISSLLAVERSDDYFRNLNQARQFWVYDLFLNIYRFSLKPSSAGSQILERVDLQKREVAC